MSSDRILFSKVGTRLDSPTRSFSDEDTVIRYENRVEEMKGDKVAGFDLDDTLTSGMALTPYPGVIEKLHSLTKEGYNIVIVSNQKKRHIGDKKLLTKLEGVSKVLGVPFVAFCARAEDDFRKPNNGILSLIPESMGKMEFFVGDAAGRPGDHSDCDKMFANNAKIPFHTANDYFIDGETLSRDILPPCLVQISGIQILTLVIMIGYSGSGKSTWCKKMLPDYEYVNRDTLKDMKKCVVKCKQELKKGNNVVIDNTNYTTEMREKFISIANEEGAQCIAVHINTSMRQSQTWNDTRGDSRTPIIVFYKYRKNFQSPTLEEGFDDIVVIE